jgi:hypothetical protein
MRGDKIRHRRLAQSHLEFDSSLCCNSVVTVTSVTIIFVFTFCIFPIFLYVTMSGLGTLVLGVRDVKFIL